VARPGQVHTIVGVGIDAKARPELLGGPPMVKRRAGAGRPVGRIRGWRSAALAKTPRRRPRRRPRRPRSPPDPPSQRRPPPPAPAPPTLTLGSAAILPLPAGSAGFVPAAMDCSTGTCVIVGYLQMPNGGVVAGAAGERNDLDHRPAAMPTRPHLPGVALRLTRRGLLCHRRGVHGDRAFGPSGSAQLNGLIES